MSDAVPHALNFNDIDALPVHMLQQVCATHDLERFPLYNTGVRNQQIQCQIGGTEPPPPGSQIKATVHGNPGKPRVQHNPLLKSNRGYRTIYVVIKLGVDVIYMYP